MPGVFGKRSSYLMQRQPRATRLVIPRDCFNGSAEATRATREAVWIVLDFDSQSRRRKQFRLLASLVATSRACPFKVRCALPQLNGEAKLAAQQAGGFGDLAGRAAIDTRGEFCQALTGKGQRRPGNQRKPAPPIQAAGDLLLKQGGGVAHTLILAVASHGVNIENPPSACGKHGGLGLHMNDTLLRKSNCQVPRSDLGRLQRGVIEHLSAGRTNYGDEGAKFGINVIVVVLLTGRTLPLKLGHCWLLSR